MIKLTRLNGTEYVLNCDMIVTIEARPDTIITSTDYTKYLCKETVDEVIEKVIEFKGRIQAAAYTYKG